MVYWDFYGSMKATFAIITSFALVSVLEAQPARANLTYNIYETIGGVEVTAAGSLILPPPLGRKANCGIVHGLLSPSNANICNGPENPTAIGYSIAGPASFGGGAAFVASSSSGIFTQINGERGIFGIDSSYTSGAPILGLSTFRGKSLASFGLTLTPSAGMWTLSNGEKIIVKVTGLAPVPSCPTSPTPITASLAGGVQCGKGSSRILVTGPGLTAFQGGTIKVQSGPIKPPPSFPQMFRLKADS